MKPIFWAGVICLVLGIASFFVGLPKTEKEGIRVGDVHLGVEEKHNERIPNWASGLLVGGGLAMMVVAGKSR